MADSRISGNVESPLAQSVVDLSTTGVDANKSSSNTAASAAGASSTSLSNTAPSSSTSTNKAENLQKDGMSNSTSATNKPLESKDGTQMVDGESAPSRSGSVSPTKVDRKSSTKKTSFKPVSVNKQFLKDTVSAASTTGSSLSSSIHAKGAVSSSGISSLTNQRPSAPSKLKLVRSGTASQTSRPNGPGAAGLGSTRSDPQPVWNKNKPTLSPPTKEFTDEELQKRYGIHLASRLHDDGNSKEAKWADIDDDDEDWVPEKIEWNDGMKASVPELAPAVPLPEPEPTKAAAPTPPAPAVAQQVPPKAPTLAARDGRPKTLVTEKPAPKAAEAASSTAPRPSPWAKIPTATAAPPVSITPQPPANAEPQRREEQPNKELGPPRDISADVYDRSWRDRAGPLNNRELFNSQTGQMEPVSDNRNRNTRPGRNEAPLSKPAVLQRPPGPPFQGGPAEPSAAFQQHRAGYRQDDYRRRASSNVSAGSGSIGRRPSFSRYGEGPGPDEMGFTQNRASMYSNPFDEGPSPRGQFGGHGPPPQHAPFHQNELSPRKAYVTPMNEELPASGLPPAPPSATSQPDGSVAETVESPEELLKKQERIMREAREQARRRRQEEEEREEAAKKERLRTKLEALERLSQEKAEQEAAKKAAEEQIAAEKRAAEEKQLADEREAADKRRMAEELKLKGCEYQQSQQQQQQPHAMRDWRQPAPQPHWGSQQQQQRGRGVYLPPDRRGSMEQRSMGMTSGINVVSQDTPMSVQHTQHDIAPPPTHRQQDFSRPYTSSAPVHHPAPVPSTSSLPQPHPPHHLPPHQQQPLNHSYPARGHPPQSSSAMIATVAPQHPHEAFGTARPLGGDHWSRTSNPPAPNGPWARPLSASSSPWGAVGDPTMGRNVQDNAFGNGAPSNRNGAFANGYIPQGNGTGVHVPPSPQDANRYQRSIQANNNAYANPYGRTPSPRDIHPTGPQSSSNNGYQQRGSRQTNGSSTGRDRQQISNPEANPLAARWASVPDMIQTNERDAGIKACKAREAREALEAQTGIKEDFVIPPFKISYTKVEKTEEELRKEREEIAERRRLNPLGDNVYGRRPGVANRYGQGSSNSQNSVPRGPAQARTSRWFPNAASTDEVSHTLLVEHNDLHGDIIHDPIHPSASPPPMSDAHPVFSEGTPFRVRLPPPTNKVGVLQLNERTSTNVHAAIYQKPTHSSTTEEFESVEQKILGLIRSPMKSAKLATVATEQLASEISSATKKPLQTSPTAPSISLPTQIESLYTDVDDPISTMPDSESFLTDLFEAERGFGSQPVVRVPRAQYAQHLYGEPFEGTTKKPHAPRNMYTTIDISNKDHPMWWILNRELRSEKAIHVFLSTSSERKEIPYNFSDSGKKSTALRYSNKNKRNGNRGGRIGGNGHRGGNKVGAIQG